MEYVFRGWTQDQIDMVMNDRIPPGKNHNQCAYFSKRYLHKGFRPNKPKATDNPRSAQLAKMHDSGMSYAEISKKVGLSRQRVGILVKNWRNANAE